MKASTWALSQRARDQQVPRRGVGGIPVIPIIHSLGLEAGWRFELGRFDASVRQRPSRLSVLHLLAMQHRRGFSVPKLGYVHLGARWVHDASRV